MAKGKVKTTGAKTKAGKLAGKTVAFAGKFGYGKYNLEALKKAAVAEGGSVVDGETTAPDYLVEGTGVGGKPPGAVAKIQKKHPQVQVIDEPGFYQMIVPTAEEFLEILQSGPQGHEFWSAMQERIQKSGATIDLSGTEFRKLTIEGILYQVRLDDCDFRGATLNDVYFDKIKGARFDGAAMSGGSFANAEDCSLKNVVMKQTRWNPAEFRRCDFTGAALFIQTGSCTRATDCSFVGADLSEADLDNSHFTRADFSDANLTGARLEKCDFTGANLAGADLTRADLREAKLTNADLSGAKLRDSLLTGTDLTGATIDGADFTGANVTGANVTGLDTSKAKNLEPRPARTAGPKLRELATVARGSKRFMTTLELDLGNGESVFLQPSITTYGTQVYPGASFWHQSAQTNRSDSVAAPTFEQGILNLTDLWSRGTPAFDTIKVEAKQCPLRGKELVELATAAWYEACGLAVPSTEELEDLRGRADTDAAQLQKVLTAELGGGPSGVKKWNARTDKERTKLGRLRKHDFSNASLAGANLGSQDFEGSTFDGANLKKAALGGSQLKGASFVKAEMGGVHLAGSKCSEASFEGATLTKCNLRAANFRRCNFQNADLTNADFSFSDLGEADFTGATLTGVEFARTRFDEKTIFPPGFVPPEGLIWKGVGSRPGTPEAAPPPPAAKSGTLDFATFLGYLNNKVEAARMQKAGSMLKAERFQLFAEVADDAITGIVKSQSSHDLVYSCRLASDGGFSCCTQNLRPCGGLRGALCKHLLVLIVGLAKAGRLDAATVDHWIDLSRRQKPVVDEDAASATFLRYKGAEAGEVDWRPTETIPEDFYAM
ncbi:pentapeptide repeat-containing protein [Fimbriiglobus ruber]|uniref:Pentapeptide repeat family protein n=1 Tax=Fimbriiglobus ruber TaxID=1908690 RepID=A0A225E139_9BACT|nr:pentapeptide repeat-containing protein [Fimbriiglobus ruber]OWK43736.1 Pentapeptide repeat family protein [Fimbriiglobus ruber]